MRINQDNPNDLLIWKINKVFTVRQAITLMYGVAPEGANEYAWTGHNRLSWPKGMTAILRLIESSLYDKTLEGRAIIYDNTGELDYEASTVNGASLTALLKEKNIQDAFFNDGNSLSLPLLDSSHQCYAPKLAAAVEAWQQAVNDASQGKTPKQRIEKWLRVNAARYGLVKEDGKLNEQAIEDISKVANWQPQGGAAKTPAVSNPEPELSSHEPKPIRLEKMNPPTPKNSKGLQGENPPIEDDIPF